MAYFVVSNMKKTLFVHIGRPKVGSSAIQHFLDSNRFGLAYLNCFYSAVGYRHRANHGLAYAIYPDADRIPEYKGVSAKAMYAQLIDELKQKPDIDNAVVSSENFYFANPKNLHQYLGENFNVKIVCYVRRQDDVLVSSYIQELKDGTVQSGASMQDYIANSKRLKWLDYDAVLKQWANVFGSNNIIVRPYEDEQFIGGNICTDILNVFKIDSPVGFEIPVGRVNPSPSRDVLQLILNINRRENVVGNARPRLIESLLEASEELPKLPAYDAKNLLSFKQRSELLSMFEESNKRVARTYLGRKDGLLFRRVVDEGYSLTEEAASLNIERLAAVVSSLLLSQQDQIVRLEREVADLKKQFHCSGASKVTKDGG